jgi:exopolyphosphatase/guanosine-5'-triphosphate,3'-diphosphate pyrophosphatase
MERKYFASIDLGSNSSRLLIVDEFGNIAEKENVKIRLAEGMQKNVLFTGEAMQRGYDCFEKFAECLAKYNIVASRFIATEACRQAKNGNDFIKNVKDRTGIDIEIISGEEEARLTAFGCKPNVKKNKKYVLITDIGGASTEVTLAKNNNSMNIIKMISIPLAARNSAEKYDLVVYNKENAEKLKNDINSYLDEFLSDFDFADYKDDIQFMFTSGIGGRATAFSNKLEEYDRSKIDGMDFVINEKLYEIYNYSLDELYNHPYIGKGRYNIIVAAFRILQTVVERFEIKDATASLNAGLEGIIEELRQDYLEKIS